jgi:hypothetical protein
MHPGGLYLLSLGDHGISGVFERLSLKNKIHAHAHYHLKNEIRSSNLNHLLEGPKAAHHK